MRFPTTPEGGIDEAEAEKMMDKAIAAGVNYIDTAYPYHGGASEPFVGKVLKKYDRNSFYLQFSCFHFNSIRALRRAAMHQNAFKAA